MGVIWMIHVIYKAYVQGMRLDGPAGGDVTSHPEQLLLVGKKLAG
jgi:hypothetical protein